LQNNNSFYYAEDTPVFRTARRIGTFYYGENQMRNFLNRHLNSIKGIACLGVVLIHIKFPRTVGEIFWVLGQFAVPLFFMISGYYMPERQNRFADIKIKKKISHIAKITTWSVLIYLLYFFLGGG